MSHNQPGSGQSGRGLGCGILVILLVLGFVLVPMMASALDEDPREYLDAHYTHVSGDDPEDEAIVYSSEEDATTTAQDIFTGSDADEQRQEGDTWYLRYDSEWLVVVQPDGSGSQIELFAFDEGYNHYGGVLFFWSGHYGRGGGGFFRGGGSGFGK